MQVRPFQASTRLEFLAIVHSSGPHNFCTFPSLDGEVTLVMRSDNGRLEELYQPQWAATRTKMRMNITSIVV